MAHATRQPLYQMMDNIRWEMDEERASIGEHRDTTRLDQLSNTLSGCAMEEHSLKMEELKSQDEREV